MAGGPHDRGFDLDEALCRLEDVLAAYPFDRALPNLEDILAAARLDTDDLRADDRALKLLHEAVVARPLGSVDQVGRVALEVELLTLEVRVLTERLATPGLPGEEFARSRQRLHRIRQRLDEVRGLL